MIQISNWFTARTPFPSFSSDISQGKKGSEATKAPCRFTSEPPLRRMAIESLLTPAHFGPGELPCPLVFFVSLRRDFSMRVPASCGGAESSRVGRHGNGEMRHMGTYGFIIVPISESGVYACFTRKCDIPAPHKAHVASTLNAIETRKTYRFSPLMSRMQKLGGKGEKCPVLSVGDASLG